LGGVSFKQRSRIIRQLFRYKPFPGQKIAKDDESKNWSGDDEMETGSADEGGQVLSCRCMIRL